MKVCTKCKQEKELDKFHKDKYSDDGFTGACKKCRNAKAKEWQNNNKAYRSEYHRKYKQENKQYFIDWYKKNRERIAKKSKEWYTKNKKRSLELGKISRRKRAHITRQRERERRRTDINFRILCNLRGRVSYLITSGKKCFRTLNSIGCKMEHLRSHIQKQFKGNMSWENYGSVWSLDHILPVTYFKLTNPSCMCNYWQNLQPLTIAENASKSDKLPDFKTVYKIMFSIMDNTKEERNGRE